MITSVADVARALRAHAATCGEDVPPGATDAESVYRTGAFHELDIVPSQVLDRHATYADLLGRVVDAQS